MERFKIDTISERWVVTDEAIDAYRAKVLVPPELAVFSFKRLKTGYLPTETIIHAINEYQPSVVRFHRFGIDPAVDSFLRESSYVVVTAAGGRNYIRADLAQNYFPSSVPPSFMWPN